MSVISKKNGDLEYLVAEGISAPHAFTTRLGGVSGEQFSSLNLVMHRGDPEENVQKNYAVLAKTLDFNLDALVLTRQVHSDIVRIVTRKDALGLDHRVYPECDALITREPGVALGIFTADCTPILFHDPKTCAVGAAHAGWRGTAADIAGKTVGAMVQAFGCCPENIRAAIGPNIGFCCFETDADVPNLLAEAFGSAVWEHIRPQQGKYYVNLKEINALALRRAGVKNIEISTACTMCEHDRFWSHRYTRGNRGSQGAIIVCKEGNV
ncbi:MAG: peptidoglycan editing factor PgeF [Oscillospiraceae bacterium]|nr:peptidoglycan editing factor PgeF [Oscillospiraceae bacterium]